MSLMAGMGRPSWQLGPPAYSWDSPGGTVLLCSSRGHATRGAATCSSLCIFLKSKNWGNWTEYHLRYSCYIALKSRIWTDGMAQQVKMCAVQASGLSLLPRTCKELDVVSWWLLSIILLTPTSRPEVETGGLLWSSGQGLWSMQSVRNKKEGGKQNQIPQSCLVLGSHTHNEGCVLILTFMNMSWHAHKHF